MCRIAYNPSPETNFKSKDLLEFFEKLENTAGRDGNGLYSVKTDIVENYLNKEMEEEDNASAKLEKKVSDAPCVTFKEDQLPSFKKDKELVVWVVNWDTSNVKFYLMTAKTSLEIFPEHGKYNFYSGGKKGWRLFEDQLDELAKTHRIMIFRP